MPAEMPKGVDLRPSGAFRARFTYRGRQYSSEWDTPKMAAAWIQRTRGELVAGTYVDPDHVAARCRCRRGAHVQGLRGEVGGRTRPQAADPIGVHAHAGQLRRPGSPPGRCHHPRHGEEVVRRATLATTARKHQYELVRAIFNSAVDDEYIDVSPVRIKGAAKVIRKPMADLPTPAQIHALADAMPTDKYRVMVLSPRGAGCASGSPRSSGARTSSATTRALPWPSGSVAELSASTGSSSWAPPSRPPECATWPSRRTSATT